MKHTTYKVTFMYTAEKRDYALCDTLEDARKAVYKRMEDDPECCAHILIAECDTDAPNKQCVSLENYKRVNGMIAKQPY